MRNVVGEGGGIYHAIIGHADHHRLAALMSVPIGLLDGDLPGRVRHAAALARWITFLVDVMTGIPSIVAGLFAYALFVLILGPACGWASAARWRCRC